MRQARSKMVDDLAYFDGPDDGEDDADIDEELKEFLVEMTRKLRSARAEGNQSNLGKLVASIRDTISSEAYCFGREFFESGALEFLIDVISLGGDMESLPNFVRENNFGCL